MNKTILRRNRNGCNGKGCNMLISSWKRQVTLGCSEYNLNFQMLCKDVVMAFQKRMRKGKQFVLSTRQCAYIHSISFYSQKYPLG